MFSVHSLLGWLDMYRGSVRRTCPKSGQLLTCEFNSRNPRASLIDFIRDVICVKVIATVCKRRIQTRFHKTRWWRKDLAAGQGYGAPRLVTGGIQGTESVF